MIVVGWLLAISMLIGQLMFGLLKFVVEDEKNTLKITNKEKEEIALILEAFQTMGISKKIMGVILMGGMAISEIAVKIINLPFKK